MTITIHGKEYTPVADRIKEAHTDLKEKEKLSITTEVLFQEPVVVKATVVTRKGTFTGISAANPTKLIEKQSPYEVAETSAVGRALGFAGYGVVDSIVSADEMVKAGVVEINKEFPDKPQAEAKPVVQQAVDKESRPDWCFVHNVQMKERTTQDGQRQWFDHRRKLENGSWERCYGKSWVASK